jgi:hypothetical protein
VDPLLWRTALRLERADGRLLSGKLAFDVPPERSSARS